MTLAEYVTNLRKFIAQNKDKHPDILKMKVIYCVDDEGNGFDTVKFTPTIGELKDNMLFTDKEESEPNVVCIN
tara:strand:- start:1354 stop:1572 length:219 start_codon:yes stop_codon:yes gene_type:complete